MSAASAKTLPIREFLEQYRGGAVYHPPLVDDKGCLVGNNGDRLMTLGTELVYEDLGLRRVGDPKRADLIVLGASGGMLDRFTHIPRLFRHLCQSFPEQPMCVLPSTFFYRTRPFAEDIGARSAPLWVFCRERHSYHHLTQEHQLPPGCEVYLDRDLAFELQGGAYLTKVRAMEPNHILMVERVDVEHVSADLSSHSSSIRARKIVGRVLPNGMKKTLYPLVRFVRSRRRTPFRKCCENLLAQHHPNLVGLPRVVADVSNVNTCTFEEFTKAVGHAAVVFTTRLHVAILGAMAGRPTFLFEGPYHKIRGVYEFSLADRDKVFFVPRSAQEIS